LIVRQLSLACQIKPSQRADYESIVPYEFVKIHLNGKQPLVYGTGNPLWLPCGGALCEVWALGNHKGLPCGGALCEVWALGNHKGLPVPYTEDVLPNGV